MILQNIFERRAFILGCFQGILFMVLITRMYWLEVVNHAHYQLLSDKNRLYSRLIAPQRGRILDRKGRVLALNKMAYRAVIIRDQTENLPQVIHQVALLLGIPEEDEGKILKEIRRKPRFMPVTLKDNLSWDDLSKIELNLPDLPGVSIDNGQSRFYPFPYETCHIVGYVGAISEKEQTGERVLELPGFRIGKSGIEKAREQDLRGLPGTKQVEVNAVRRVVRELDTFPSQPGPDITLTIDLELQQSVMQRLSMEQRAMAVVMDVRTGAVRAMVSYPGFDSNLFPMGIRKDDWNALLSHPHHVLMNKAISGLYPPGSPFKMIVAMAGLESGLITKETAVFCPGYIELGQHRFHCHKAGGHGTVRLLDALAQSCDVYFFHVGGLIGIDAIATTAHQFGFGEKTGIHMPSEKAGIVPSKSWKQKLMGNRWTLGETYNASIGQGYVLATPLQLAVMTARLATGKEVRPCLYENEIGATYPLPIHPAHLALVQEGMNQVVNSPRGTAKNAQMNGTGWQLAGKTGTAQVRRISSHDRKLGLHKKAGEWMARDHAFFVAFAPVGAPKYAVIVLVEHGGSGSKIAAPIAKDIMVLAKNILENAKDLNSP